MQDTPETPGTGGPDPVGGTPTPTPPPSPVPPAGTTTATAGATKGIVARAKDIVTQPAREWDVIAAEPATIGPALTYVLILAAIGPIAMVIGHQLVGISWFGVTWRPPIGYSIVNAVLAYGVSIAAVFICSFIIDALATSFGGTKNHPQAFKVAAYSATPGYLAGILNIIPTLGLLAILASIYGIYLLYLGLPRLMRAPQDKAVGYTVVVVLAYIVVFIVLGYIVAMLLMSVFASALTPGAIRY